MYMGTNASIDTILNEIFEDEHEYCFDRSYCSDESWIERNGSKSREQAYLEVKEFWTNVSKKGDKEFLSELEISFGDKYDYLMNSVEGETFMNDCIYFLIWDVTENDYGYGYIYDSFDGTTDHLRSLAFQDRLDIATLEDPELYEVFESAAKTYIADHANIEDGMRELLDFWFIGPSEEMTVHELASDIAAVKIMKESNIDYVFYRIKHK